MKPTKELKEKLGGAQSNEEITDILNKTKKSVEAAGVVLDDVDLDQVAGGALKRSSIRV